MLGIGLTSKFPFIRAFGNLPTNLPPQGGSGDDSDLSGRSVSSDSLGDFYLLLPPKIPPKQVESILRMALAGNVWQSYQLLQLMRDSWPMLRSKEFELRTAIANSQFVVHPYSTPGEEPTDTAKAKADLVRRSMGAFRPQRFQDEDGWNGFVFNLTEAIMLGVSITELIWDEDAADDDGNPEKNIRAAAWVHPRHYTFQADGSLGVSAAESYNFLSFPSQFAQQPILDNPSKFIVSKFKSKSGSPLGAGFMRTLAYYWCTVVYGRDFMLSFAQKYGNPFLDIAYQAGISQPEIVRFEDAAKAARNQGYIVRANNGTVQILPPQNMGESNPQLQLQKLADEAVQILLMGQTLTSTTPKFGGTRAQGEVHADVKQERLECLLNWVSEILAEQWVESLLIENYGESSERPTIKPDLTRPLDALEQAQYLTALSTCTVPLPVDDTYKKLGVTPPEEGDQVIVGGKIGALGATDTEIEANPAPAPPPGLPPNGEEQPSSQEQQQAIGSRLGVPSLRGTDLRRLIAKASRADVIELQEKIRAAQEAKHRNGEFTALNDKIAEMRLRYKV